ncbi:RrF2 family transcriptional regulator [Corynebacterium canis]|uniref:RrF2 family transcriptional regulator n=1 Tax=Corynebacterium canis TaxID=679663 RepID=UPI001FE8A071|nr:Rrf2 family transcriptional regulator [Corynebacterium canis]
MIFVHLTRFSDLGMRLVMRLGVADPSERLTVSKLAADIHASEAHVAKVVARLVELGVARSVRGRSGGVYIREDAFPLGLGKLIRSLEGDSEMVDCFTEDPCPFIRHDCLLRIKLADAKEAFYQSLDQITLGELLADAQARYPAEFVLKE